jgi:hypothetical protein
VVIGALLPQFRHQHAGEIDEEPEVPQVPEVPA